MNAKIENGDYLFKELNNISFKQNIFNILNLKENIRNPKNIFTSLKNIATISFDYAINIARPLKARKSDSIIDSQLSKNSISIDNLEDSNHDKNKLKDFFKKEFEQIFGEKIPKKEKEKGVILVVDSVRKRIESSKKTDAITNMIDMAKKALKDLKNEDKRNKNSIYNYSYALENKDKNDKSLISDSSYKILSNELEKIEREANLNWHKSHVTVNQICTIKSKNKRRKV